MEEGRPAMNYEWPADFWPIQTAACTGVVDAYSEGIMRVVLTAPTGTGKTRAMIALLEWATSMGMPSVLYSHRRMLLRQTAGVLERHGIDYGMRASGYDTALTRDVQLAMLQTEMSAVLKKQKRSLHAAKLVLIDELHAHGGGTLQEFLRQHHKQGALIVGVTATPLDLEGEWDRLIIAGKTSDGRKCGALVPAYTVCPDEPDMKLIHRYKVQEGQDLTDKQNHEVIMRPGIFGRVYDHWKRLNQIGRASCRERV
jgi:superfamily II DNA or RNA helicase